MQKIGFVAEQKAVYSGRRLEPRQFRINLLDKNRTATQQADNSLVMADSILISQTFYSELNAVFRF
jgi:hypothetical protein